MSVRFAPSPTGALHLGNFRTAWISWMWAKWLDVPWVVRFEDIDTPRVLAGSQERQLSELTELGLKPNQIVIQSERRKRHFELFETAKQKGQVYACHCSRKEILSWISSAPHAPEALYSGQCRHRKTENPKGPTMAWRFRAEEESGHQDFIVARTALDGESDFSPAYHWACAIDDFDGGHLLLVRAYDLWDATLVQRRIQSWLNSENSRAFSAVFHTALVTTDHKQRLEKRTPHVTWPELKQLGFTPKKLIQLFEASLTSNSSEFASQKVWGEAQRSLTLSELGFRPSIP